jgi:hypothetical protein
LLYSVFVLFSYGFVAPGDDIFLLSTLTLLLLLKAPTSVEEVGVTGAAVPLAGDGVDSVVDASAGAGVADFAESAVAVAPGSSAEDAVFSEGDPGVAVLVAELSLPTGGASVSAAAVGVVSTISVLEEVLDVGNTLCMVLS